MKTLIIDTSYLIYRSYFAYPNLTFEEKHLGAVFGFSKTIINLLQEYNPDNLIFALDLPEPTWRHKELPEYKAGRAKIEPEMVSQIPLVIEWAKTISENVFSCSGYEADDIIFSASNEILLPDYGEIENNEDEGSLFKSEKSKPVSPEFPLTVIQSQKSQNQTKNEVLIFSSDKDLYQLLVYPEIKFIKTEKGKQGFQIFGKNDFISKYELLPHQWLDYKALVGDPSDNLKGVDGIGIKTATKILNECGSLYNIFEELNLDSSCFKDQRIPSQIFVDSAKEFVANPKNQKLIEKIKESQETLCKTHRLATLKMVSISCEPKGKITPIKGKELFQKYGFKSLLKTIQNLEEKDSNPEALF